MTARQTYDIDPPLEETAGDTLRASVSQVLVRGDDTHSHLEIFNGVPDPIFLDQLNLGRAARRARA